MAIGRLPIAVVLLVLVALAAAVPPQSTAASRVAYPLASTPVGTAFTYQGTLANGSGLVTGSCDFQFALYDAATGGTQVGTTQTSTGVGVVQGRFTAVLDFGAVFDGNVRWLEVAVRCPSGSGSYATLAPRQQLTPTPYAIYAAQAGAANTANSAPWSGLTGVPSNISSIAGLSCSTGQVIKANGSGWVCAADNNTTYSAGSGLTLSGTTFALDTTYTDGRYWKLTGNAGTDPATNFLGTTDSQPLIMKVNNATALQLQPTSGTPNLIGGSSGNSVTAGVVGATITGGSQSGPNVVTDDYGAVGGGEGNRAGDNAGTTSNASDATVGGGISNQATNKYATVGGGVSNLAVGNGSTVGGGIVNQATGGGSTVGGGTSNQATGGVATVGGGFGNQATNAYATVPGGSYNVASGRNSFAAGSRAVADADGVFTWADNATPDTPIRGGDVPNTFNARAVGGFYFYTDVALDSGAILPAGGGAWSSLSDRNSKTNIAPVDPVTVLARVATLPIATWNYKTQAATIQHLGPMAQDFAAAFGLGEDDRHISTIDSEGVALAAIQGLAQRDNELQADNESLKADLTAMHTELSDLKLSLATNRPIAPATPALTLFQILLLALLSALVLAVFGGVVVLRRPRRA